MLCAAYCIARKVDGRVLVGFADFGVEVFDPLLDE